MERTISVLGLLVAVVGVIVGVTNPEARCLLGLKSDSCPLKSAPPTSLPSSSSSPTEPTETPESAPTKPASPTPLPPNLVPATEFECNQVYGYVTEQYNELISVGKVTEQPDFRFLISMSNPKSTTCRIIKNSGVVKLKYALPDNSYLNRVNLKVYVDGSLKKDLDFARGQAVQESIDVKGASGFTVDFAVLSQDVLFGDYIYLIPT